MPPPALPALFIGASPNRTDKPPGWVGKFEKEMEAIKVDLIKDCREIHAQKTKRQTPAWEFDSSYQFRTNVGTLKLQANVIQTVSKTWNLLHLDLYLTQPPPFDDASLNRPIASLEYGAYGISIDSLVPQGAKAWGNATFVEGQRR